MYFTERDTQLSLRRPYEIYFSKKMVQKLCKRYNKKCERGGFVSGKLMHIFGRTVINLEKIFPIANVSPSPRCSYIPRFSHAIDVLTRLRYSFPKYIPFTYHTHPGASFVDLLDSSINLEKLLSAVINQSPSDTDLSIVQSIPSNIEGKPFLLPNLLITKNLQGNFIAFVFGPGTDYEDISFPHLSKWTDQKIDWTLKQIQGELFPWLKDQWNIGFWNKVKISGVTFLSAIIITDLVKIYPELAINLLMALFLGYMNYDSLQQVNNPILIKSHNEEAKLMIANNKNVTF